MPTKDLLQKHNFVHQKKYGQNFLTNVRIPERIADECTGLTREFFENGGKCESLILEIGPGAGILTRELAKRYEKVVAVEIDETLIPVLDEALSDLDNVTVVNADIMELELDALLSKHREKCGGILPVSVCANLPYYITSPVIMKLLSEYDGFDNVTVMVQKEVAMRLCAKAGSENYGALSAAVGLYADAERLFTVSAGSFNPRPKVDSAVVRMKIRHPNPYMQDIENASRLIKAAFGTRRKTLVNSLLPILENTKLESKEELTETIARRFKNPNIRGEELSPKDFAELSKILF